VTFFVDGENIELPVDMEGGLGKMGWFRTVDFTAPEDALEIIARLRVLYDGRPFEVTAVFERCINPTVNPDIKWESNVSDAVSLEE